MMLKDSIALFAISIGILKTSRNCLYGLIHVLATNKQSSSSLDQMEQGGNYIYIIEIISKWTHFIHLYALNPFSP